MNNKIKNIVIAGGGTAGWMAATALTRKLGHLVKVTLVESEAIGTIGVGESTIPPLRSFHQLVGIDEAEFMKATSATFKLGINFEGWRDQNSTYFHAFGVTGRETLMAGFQSLWLRGIEKGFASDFGDYCFELVAAKQNKFALLPDNGMQYAYHLDATAYAKYLRGLSEALPNFKRLEGKIESVQQDHDTGFITGLKLESGEKIEGDFFIDCTGFTGLLIEKTLKTGYEDWRHWLPCDSAIVAQSKSMGPPVPYTRAVAHDAGWRWRIPLQHRMGNGLVYCSANLSDDAAKQRFVDEVEGELVTEPRKIGYTTGRRRKSWNKNCLALGLSAGFVEPLESTGIHMFMAGIIRFLQLFPFGGILPAQMDEYNRQSRKEIERIRDFIVLHYHVTERDDSEFWQFCRNMELPPGLKEKIDLFRESSMVFREEWDTFRVESWAQVMIGQGITPNSYHQTAGDISDEQLEKFLTSVKDTIHKKVGMLPAHHEFIRKYCTAAPR